MKTFLRKHKTFFSVFWLVFTVSLGIWWFYLSLANTNQLMLLSQELGGSSLNEKISQYDRQRTMIILEGIVFLLMLTTGGMILIWFVYKDSKRNQLIQDFFSTVTHEMKTPLTSLQLQIESLIEDFSGKPVESRLKKVLKQNQRIERQMNKAFYLASLMRSEKLYIEEVSLNQLLDSLAFDWKELNFNPKKNIIVWADIRALESILKNIFENAVVHGKASKIDIKLQKNTRDTELHIHDNGIGFHGNVRDLGRAFKRHSSSSGSGIGYYIIFNLLKKMNASIQFIYPTSKGFQLLIIFPNKEKGNHA